MLALRTCQLCLERSNQAVVECALMKEEGVTSILPPAEREAEV